MTEILRFNQFTRVLINKAGDAVTQARCFDLRIVPAIGFLRRDGWSLGCPIELESVAFKMFEDEWTHFYVSGDDQWRPISEYIPLNGW